MIIPIGLQCSTATFKGKIENTHTLPFDWMLSTPEFVFKILKMLLEDCIDTRDLVTNHFFLCDKRASLTNVENYVTSESGFALLNSKYGVVFPHDEHTPETIEKYMRRFDRLRNIILSSEEYLHFVYASQSSNESGNFTIDGVPVVENVYRNLSNIQELISRFRDDNFRVVIFDTLQNESTDLLNKKIKLIRLQKCSSWNEVVPQMLKCLNFFE